MPAPHARRRLPMIVSVVRTHVSHGPLTKQKYPQASAQSFSSHNSTHKCHTLVKKEAMSLNHPLTESCYRDGRIVCIALRRAGTVVHVRRRVSARAQPPRRIATRELPRGPRPTATGGIHQRLPTGDADAAAAPTPNPTATGGIPSSLMSVCLQAHETRTPPVPDAHRIPQNSTRQPPPPPAAPHGRVRQRHRPKSRPHGSRRRPVGRGSPPARGAHKSAAVHAHGERQCANSERVGAAASSSTRSSSQVNWSGPPKTFRFTHP